MPELSPHLFAIRGMEGLRRATSADDVAVARLWRAAWCTAHPEITTVDPHGHWLSRVRADFGSPRLSLVWEEEGQLQAFLVLEMAQHYLYQLFVAPARQSQGLGSQMLRWVCEVFPTGWSLHTATSNLRGRQLYERFGLQVGEVDINPVSKRERVIYRWQNLERHCQD